MNYKYDTWLFYTTAEYALAVVHVYDAHFLYSVIFTERENGAICMLHTFQLVYTLILIRETFLTCDG